MYDFSLLNSPIANLHIHNVLVNIVSDGPIGPTIFDSSAIDGNIFNKHNDQEKKTLVKKDLFYLHGIYSIQTSLF